MLVPPSGKLYFEIDVSGQLGLQAFDSNAYTATFWHNGGVDPSVILTIANPSTGQYVGSATIPSGYTVGDICWVRISGNIEGLTVAVISEYITVWLDSSGGSSAAEVWDYLLVNAAVSGTFGYAVQNITGGDSPGTTTLLTRLSQGILFDGSGNVKSNAETVSDKSGYTLSVAPPTTSQIASVILKTPGNLLTTDSNGAVTTGTNEDKTGYSLTIAPPTVSQIASAILLIPANKLSTDASGNISINNLPTEYLTSTEQAELSSILSIAETVQFDGSDYVKCTIPVPATVQILNHGIPNLTQDEVNSLRTYGGTF